jgi:dihydroorotate dehydrogenase/ferredoxin
MADLSTSVAGVKMPSPIGVASTSPWNWFYPAGSLDKWVDWNKRLVDQGAGFFVTPSMGWSKKAKPYSQWYWHACVQKAEPDGLWVNTQKENLADMDDGLEELEALRKALPAEVPIIGSIISPSPDPEIYRKNAKSMESAGADMIELNGGCPLRVGEKPPGTPYVKGEEFGMMLGVAPELVKPVIKAMTESVKIPVGIKLTPMAGYPGLLTVASAAINAGAKYLLTTHSTLGLPPPDIHNGGTSTWPAREHWQMGNYVSGFIGGQANRNQGLFYTMLASSIFPNVDRFGGSGVMTMEHAAQLIMLGANGVQVCAGFIQKGRTFLGRMVKSLNSYMDQYGYKTIEDFRGLGLRHVRGFEDDAKAFGELRLVSATDENKCDGCGICADTLCPARYMENGLAMVREEDCSLCGLCAAICPRGAVYFAPSRSLLAERRDTRPY